VFSATRKSRRPELSIDAFEMGGETLEQLRFFLLGALMKPVLSSLLQ
jgi:hypothetical protein